jgi:hypothetical protein
MAKLTGASAERLANYFVDYLYDDYRGSRHVRRVASWTGLLVLGIERLGVQARVPRTRQLVFRYKNRAFKMKYNHKAGPRGGIDLIEVLPGRGMPEGPTVRSIRSLSEAERFYLDCERHKPWHE